MLFYAYPPDKKNKDYIVEYIEAVYFTNDGSMLSIVKWMSSKVLMDNVVGEEHYSQFKGLFKAKFGEKEWDLQQKNGFKRWGDIYVIKRITIT